MLRKIPEREVTLRDVARRAGVSLQTVSNVVNQRDVVAPDTKARVDKAIGELRYRTHHAARALRHGVTHTIACVVTDAYDSEWFQQAYFSRLFSAIAAVAEAADYHVLVHAVRDEQALTLQHLFEERRIDGAIIAAATSPMALLETMAGWGYPCSFVDRAVAGATCSVGAYLEPVASLVQHLVERGAREPVYLAGGLLETTARGSAVERRDGFLLGLKRARLKRRAAAIVPCGWSVEEGRRAMATVLDGGVRCDAVVGASDAVALGALLELRARGIQVPDQVLVAGFDNEPLSEHVAPALTTVHLELEGMARHATQALLEQLRSDGEFETSQRLFDSPLLLRASTVGGSP